MQVDTNVTRHVQPEIAKEDWTAIIFHYLGLDHIGHTGGPKRSVFEYFLTYTPRLCSTQFQPSDDGKAEGDG